MRSAPDDLPEDVLASALAHGWGVTVASMGYRPVGFGSHHWEVLDAGGTRWFVAVDELEKKRHTRDESLDMAYRRLRAALDAARELFDSGRTYVVAPVRAGNGEPLSRTGRFGVALYPYVDGQSFSWGEFSSPEHLKGVLDIVVDLHTAPRPAQAMVDDFAIPHRDGLEAALGPGDSPDWGPYAHRTARLVHEYAEPLRRLLDAYDELVRQRPASRAVLTHGEPHPGNTMLAADGWRLIDWETALVAPPERDLWGLDRTVLPAYADATGVTPLPSMLELYRIRWDIADVAVDVGRFRQPHPGNLDDEKSWEILHHTITHLAR